MTMKTYMINHISIKQVWLEENIILIKDVQKWVDEKLLKNPMKKKVFHNISYVATLALGLQPRPRGCKGVGQKEARESHQRLPGV
jgi:hypothetical protein